MERQLLSGNEAIALGAAHAGVRVAAAYPGTPSTEILEAAARFPEIYTEWSSNEAVAVEVALGASYTGVRAMASMKHVGLNVAADAFMAAATTGVRGGLVIISADDPGIHSSQNEQDSRNYARLGRVPCLEPADSQEAYTFTRLAFELSEEFDTPVLLRPTTRVCHSKSVVQPVEPAAITLTPQFVHEPAKLVMLPGAARGRWPKLTERLEKLAAWGETAECNHIINGSAELGIITSGISFHYAREVFPEASFLKLGLSYPLPERKIKEFTAGVSRIMVIEENDGFLELQLKAMGLSVIGKAAFPRTGEYSPDIIRAAAAGAGLTRPGNPAAAGDTELAKRPPLLCPGCPHAGIYFTLSSLGHRSVLPGRQARPPRLTICGDIGCYTLGAYAPLSAMDTCGCMGAGISQAAGMARAGLPEKPLAVIGDSTFMHSGINSLLNAVYNQANICVLILDNATTAMTGHQGHPGSGVSPAGERRNNVVIENLVRGAGVADVTVVDAFDLKAVRNAVKQGLAAGQLAVVIVRGDCPTLTRKRGKPRLVNEKCDDCGACLLVGCSAIQRDEDGHIFIDRSVCVGEYCTICQQVCPRGAIVEAETAS
ncbi:MAG: thiamine pyrophosphate-dependent enzyme [Dehalogenimonas sp.]|uniref:Indolepyruvate oxidoreductase subunit IorA n=1 Tax=Candidatus Dehalogenimonas loeffleri TaxID=3127115 RepID=A0ABZ2J720_9CHLR|nr:thiamine pyrophosphate-dependent enzyme [Dehalogenimonas sp.]